MNKESLMKLLDSLNYPKEEYYVLSGSCMVLYGLREIANDLDLCISEKLFELIKNQHNNIELIPNECGFYKIDSNIEVVVNKREKFEFDIVDGYQVEKLENILNWKIKQGREKDLLDIEKIQKFLESNHRLNR